ncbi:MAG: bifunctional phosphoribosylaminoimidazolecarboxamide formyltransferase/IMP cyclohydrolase [Pseudomonadota bacterium]
MSELSLKRALLSVSDKTGLLEFAQDLHHQGIELVSTGGTAKALKEAGLPVRDVSEITGMPEMMDGRVKTLHPKVHGGLLARRNEASHRQALNLHQIPEIDLLVVSLYPFEETVAKGASYDDVIENIDIGGPAMIRGAAKNHESVCVITDSEDYAALLAELKEQQGKTRFEFRKKLAAKAYARTAAYDSFIANWFANEIGEPLPRWFSLGGKQAQQLRYGENPHQSAALYRTLEKRPGVLSAVQLQGKELSYNNINDTDAAFELAAEFNPKETAAVAIIKHANPCGVGTGTTLADAYKKALLCDSVSAFGGIVAMNQRLDEAAAVEIIKIFTEVIIAPDASGKAKELIASKKNLRLLLTGGLPDSRAGGTIIKSVAGGFLVQGRDNIAADDLELKVVTERQPTERELEDLRFAFKVAKHVKSNTIVYALKGATVGIGAGQMSRVDAARIAALKAVDAAEAAGSKNALTIGSVAASDAFFPFADGLKVVIDAGATAVIQPGGSLRDKEVIDAANAAGIAMVFTGVRHFRH